MPSVGIRERISVLEVSERREEQACEYERSGSDDG